MSRMTIGRDAAMRGLLLTRRAALLAPLGALAGCSLWDNWFGSNKKPLPGKRQTVAEAQGTLAVDEGVPKVVLPPPVRNAAWPQDGGNPSHLMGHLAVGDRLSEAWSSGLRRRRHLHDGCVRDGVGLPGRHRLAALAV
jgi:outer membrane protein assembly factor BamB